MDYAALATTIIGHPLTWAAVTLVAAPLAAWLLLLQLRAIGLRRRPHQAGIAWELVLSFLVFWLVLVLGLGAIAEHAEISGLRWALGSLGSSLLALIAPALILAGAGHYARARQDQARDGDAALREQITTELRWLRLAAGGLAAVALIGGRLIWPLVVVGIAGAVLWWMVSPKARETTKGWWTALQEGRLGDDGGEPPAEA